MIHMVFVTLTLIVLTACTAPMKKEYDLSKLQPNERVYIGNIQVTLNEKTNPDLTCDLFLNSDIAAMIRLSPSGDYSFKSNRKSLAFSKISCIHKIGNKSVWAKQSLDLKRIERPQASDVEHRLDNIVINWVISENEFKQDDIDAFGTSGSDKFVGKIEVKSLPYLETPDQQ